jgi:hypothetical protein
LKEGWRLVTNEKSPKEYDLALSWAICLIWVEFGVGAKGSL